jgi:antitoxin HicB
MNFEYPLNIAEQDDGSYLVAFPDIPEALTDGETVNEAMSEASDCLIAALGGYINENRNIPKPSLAEPGQKVIVLPPLVSAKVALYQAMREANVTCAEISKRLGVSEKKIRCLLDMDHKSHIGQVDEALFVLGKRLVVNAQNAA